MLRCAPRRLCAECGIPGYGVLDVAPNVLVVHAEPCDGAYARVPTHGKGARIALAQLPDVDDILR